MLGSLLLLVGVALGGPRIVAVGDVHGDLDAARKALRLGGVLGPDDRWSGGATVLVQLGDVLDRGDDEKAILELFERLAVEAPKAGGAFVMLLGNHELMNVAGDLRYATPGGLAAFGAAPPDDASLARVPVAARGRVAAFRPGGPWAAALADQPVILVRDGTVFVHGGLLPAHVAHGVDRYNAEAAAWLAGTGPIPPWALRPDGPLWVRDLSRGEPDCAGVGAVLDAVGAARIVVAHTPQPDGITAACDGRVWRVDTGMSRAYGGPVQVLEITEAGVRVLGR